MVAVATPAVRVPTGCGHESGRGYKNLPSRAVGNQAVPRRLRRAEGGFANKKPLLPTDAPAGVSVRDFPQKLQSAYRPMKVFIGPAPLPGLRSRLCSRPYRGRVRSRLGVRSRTCSARIK